MGDRRRHLLLEVRLLHTVEDFMGDHLLELGRAQRRRMRIDDDRTGFVLMEKLGEGEGEGAGVVVFRPVVADERDVRHAALGFIKGGGGFEARRNRFDLRQHRGIAGDRLGGVDGVRDDRPAAGRHFGAVNPARAQRQVGKAALPESRAVLREGGARPQERQHEKAMSHGSVSPPANGDQGKARPVPAGPPRK